MNTEGIFGGSNWVNITVQEKIHFHGIVLKMSVDNRELGEDKSYFTEQLSVNLSRTYLVLLKNYLAWAM